MVNMFLESGYADYCLLEVASLGVLHHPLLYYSDGYDALHVLLTKSLNEGNLSKYRYNKLDAKMVIQNVCTQLGVPNVLPVRHPPMELIDAFSLWPLETTHHIVLWSSLSRIGNPRSSYPHPPDGVSMIM